MTARRFTAVGTIAGAALLLAACGGGDSPDGNGGSDNGDSSGEPYRVLVTGAISGSGALADNAATSILSAQASVELANDGDGILDRPIELEVVDDAADPTKAVTALQEAIADEKPDLVLNSGPSTVAAAMLPILSQNEILSFNIGPTEDSEDASKFPLNFDLSPSPRDYARGFVPHFEENDYETVGIVHGSSSYGVAFANQLEGIFDDEGFDVTEVQEYDVEALDMTPQLQTIKATDPDALVVDAYGPPLGYLLQSMDKLDWDVPIVGDNSVAATSLISEDPPEGVLGTPEVENLVMQVFQSTKYDEDATDLNEAVEKMAELGDIKSSLILAYNFDAIRLVMAAAEDVGSADDPAALAAALEDPAVQEAADTVILRTYNFDAEDHSAQASSEDFLFIEPSHMENGQFQ